MAKKQTGHFGSKSAGPSPTVMLKYQRTTVSLQDSKTAEKLQVERKYMDLLESERPSTASSGSTANSSEDQKLQPRVEIHSTDMTAGCHSPNEAKQSNLLLGAERLTQEDTTAVPIPNDSKLSEAKKSSNVKETTSCLTSFCQWFRRKPPQAVKVCGRSTPGGQNCQLRFWDTWDVEAQRFRNFTAPRRRARAFGTIHPTAVNHVKQCGFGLAISIAVTVALYFLAVIILTTVPQIHSIEKQQMKLIFELSLILAGLGAFLPLAVFALWPHICICRDKNPKPLKTIFIDDEARKISEKNKKYQNVNNSEDPDKSGKTSQTQ